MDVSQVWSIKRSFNQLQAFWFILMASMQSLIHIYCISHRDTFRIIVIKLFCLNYSKNLPKGEGMAIRWAAASHRGAPCSLVSHTFGLVSNKDGEQGDKWIKAEEINSAGESDGNHSNCTWNSACWVSLPPASPQPSEHGGQRPWGGIKQELMVFHCDTDGECVPEVCLLIVFRPCKSTIILPPQSENTQE